MEKIDKIKVIERLDWIKLHKMMTFSSARDQVIIWDNGEITRRHEGDRISKEESERIIHVELPMGIENDHTSYCFDGWATCCDDGVTAFIHETGKYMSIDDAINLRIETGNFDILIGAWKEGIIECIQEAPTCQCHTLTIEGA